MSVNEITSSQVTPYFLAISKNEHVYLISLRYFHDIDIADPSSMQDVCHLRTQ